MTEGSWYAMNWWRSKEEERLRKRVDELLAENEKYRAGMQENCQLRAKVEELQAESKELNHWAALRILDLVNERNKANKDNHQLKAKVEELEKAAKGVRHLVESAAIAHLGKVPDESGLEWVRVPAWFVDGLVDEVTPEPPGEQHE